MPTPAENALINALTDVEALEHLVELGLAAECIPTPKLAEIIAWACDYFIDSRRTQAPERSVLQATWGAALDAMGAELEAEDVQVPQISWAVRTLKEQYLHLQYQQILIDGANAMATTNTGEKAAVVHASMARLQALADTTAETRIGEDGRTGLEASVARYEHRVNHPESMRGLGLGLPAVDEHTGGIQRGECAAVIAPEKTGKSNMALWSAKEHFQAYQDSVTVLYTLENSVKAAYDRLACMVAQIDYTDYQWGRVAAADLAYLRDWQSDHAADLAERFFVMQPGEGGRTAAAMCQTARARGADAVIFDQLSHFEITRNYRTDREETKRAINELIVALSDGGGQREPLSGLLLHQASREAAEAAKKTGTLGTHGGAGTSEIERAVDMYFGLFQSEDDAGCDEASLELLAFRRGPAKAKWQLAWRPWAGDVHVLYKPVMSGGY